MKLLPLPNFLLENQIAVVTGGGSGIGRGAALAFAAAGAHVVVLDADEAAVSQVADEIGTSGRAVVADVRDAEAIEQAFADVALSYGRVDVLFNNAGINRRHPSLELTRDEWNAVVAVNMTGMFVCARAAVRHMVTGGRIVNTASMLGLSGGRYPNIAYQATKGAAVNMTRS
jgi:NAD(P)-dependent dehydrogenase (short-subunit alcohol dehydrogenase family)